MKHNYLQLFIFFLSLSACQSTPTQPSSPPHANTTQSVNVVAVTSTTITSSSPTVPVAPELPSKADKFGVILPSKSQLKALFSELHPHPTTSTLLLGIHQENIESYFSIMGSTGGPVVDTRPGYRTLGIQHRGGKTLVVGELPYLTIPQGKGFLFVGESSYAEDLSEKEPPTSDTDPPKQYTSTKLWQTKQQKKIASLSSSLTARLKSARTWGITNSETILLATPKAMCVERSKSQFTGGATYFTGEIRQSLQALTGRVPKTFFEKFGEKDTKKLVSKAENIDFTAEPSKWTKGSDLGWGMVVRWNKDMILCLERHLGQTYFNGAYPSPGNSARSFTKSVPWQPADGVFAPGNTNPIIFEKVHKLFPKLVDMVLSPAQDFLIVILQHRILGFDVASQSLTLNKTLPLRGAVMVEWVADDHSPFPAPLSIKTRLKHLLRNPTTMVTKAAYNQSSVFSSLSGKR
jgi:hypothetical protein